MVGNPSPAFILYLLLDACKEVGIEPPKGTGHIVADAQLCEHLANHDLACQGYTMPITLMKRAFEGLPVKQVKGLVGYAQKNIPQIEERDSYLRYRARKREEAA